MNPKYTNSFGLSLAICSVLNALLVIIKEKSPAIMNLMQRATGHQWITHCAIVLVAFVMLGLLFAQVGRTRAGALASAGLITTIMAGVTAGVLLILGFYLIAD